MIPAQLLRSVLVGVGTFALGLVLLLSVARDSGSGPKRGIRIGRVEEAEAAAAREAEPVLPGVPNIRELSGPRYHRYESVELVHDGRTETVRYLAYHLACERVLPGERRAENVVFSLYPKPESPEAALLLASEDTDPVAVITAGVATADRVFSADGSGDEDWVLTLSGGVLIHSLEKDQRATLEAENLVCYAAERRVTSSGAVSIRAQEYEINGVGLSGDAGLGTFSVERDVSIVLPTAALLGKEAKEETPTETTVRCGGPLFVQRLGSARKDDGRTPTRVNFENGVAIVQGGVEESETTTLDAHRVDLLLSVLTKRDPADDEDVVRVETLVAEGDVRFRRGEETRADAARLTVERREDGARLLFAGPAEFDHRGVLPMPGSEGEEVESPGRIHVSAGREIEIVRTGDSLRGSFSGGVVTKRRSEDGDVILTLESRELSLASIPDLGEELTASGAARFRTPSIRGKAETILWRSERDGVVTYRLSGTPSVDVRGAAGTSPLAPPEPGAADDAEPKPILHLESEGPLVMLDREGETTFEVTGPALVTRSLRGVEQLRVRAGSVDAVLAGEVLESLTAEGDVSARGSAPELGGGVLTAEAESFKYSETDGLAVVTGAPAVIRIAETATEANEIRAPRLELRPADGLVRATGGVDARVFLEEEDGEKVRPIRLVCETLVVVPKPEEPGVPAPKDPAGRIQRLEATGDVTLNAMEWKGRGERLVVTTESGQAITLEGEPAIVTRVQELAGAEFEDRFTADGFTLALKDEKIVSFDSPNGGEFRLYREFRDDSPKVFGEGEAKPGARTLERFSGVSRGRMTFDEPGGLARMEGRADVEQAAGVPGRLERVATFSADLLEARFDKDEDDGALILRRAEGRGRVEGEGEGWQAFADGFSVDFKNTQTIVWGKPARVLVSGEEQTVVRAVYDYERDEWSEFFRAEGR